MNKKIFAILAVVLLVSTSVLAFVPNSEAKTVKDTYNQNLVNNPYVFCQQCTIKEDFFFDATTLINGLYVYKATDGKYNEVANAVMHGDINEVKGRIISTDVQPSGDYIFMKIYSGPSYCYINYYAYDEHLPEKKSYRGMSLENVIGVLPSCVYLKMECAKGDNVTVRLNCDDDPYLSAFIVTKKMMNDMKQKWNNFEWYGTYCLFDKNREKEIKCHTDGITNGSTMRFTSDGVTEYYVVIAINNVDNARSSGLMFNFNGSIEASGMSDTANPLPFALILVVLSIALLGVIVYFAKKKVIE